MRLLILTQVVDHADPILGFFHEWITELAARCERVTVICLREGVHNLPTHVRVLSLGKEKRTPSRPNVVRTSRVRSLFSFLFSLFSRSLFSLSSRARYVYRFYRYAWRERKNYDAVFVHMNQEYVLAAGLLWRLMGKRVILWRNHYAGSFLTGIAAHLAHRVCFTSAHSYTARYHNAVRMPVGIPDHLFFAGGVARAPHSILSLGRITPSKKIEQLIEALALLAARGVPFSATIAGGTQPEHEAYREGLVAQAARAGIADRVLFLPGVSYEQTRELYASHEVFVNMSRSGMLDKTIFEAMLCETLVTTCNRDLRTEIDERYCFSEDSPADIARVLGDLLKLPAPDRQRAGQELRSYVFAHHSLAHLADRLIEDLGFRTTPHGLCATLWYSMPCMLENRWVRFIVSGACAAAIGLVTLHILVEWFGMWYVLASALAFFFVLITNFFIQRHWTFKSSMFGARRQFMLFVVLSGLNLVGNSVGMYVLVEYVALHQLVAQAVLMVALAVVNYSVYGRYVFTATSRP